MRRFAALLLIVLGAGCASADLDTGRYTMTAVAENAPTGGTGVPVPLDPTRPVSERDCGKAIEPPGGNLHCR